VLHLPTGRALAGLAGSPAPIVTWEADVAAFCAAISSADLYIGYDSAGQHVAAALGVPPVSVFLAAAGERHAERWRPHGERPVHVVRSAVPADAAALLDRVRAEVEALAREPRYGALIDSPAPAA
jgi:ADP-heptose:LPS heptosyltransferase